MSPYFHSIAKDRSDHRIRNLIHIFVFEKARFFFDIVKNFKNIDFLPCATNISFARVHFNFGVKRNTKYKYLYCETIFRLFGCDMPNVHKTTNSHHCEKL